MSIRWLSAVVVAMTLCVVVRAEDVKVDYADLAKKLADGNAADRDEAESKLRKAGRAAIPALRDAKPEKEDAVARVRNTLVDIAIDVARIEPEDAAMLHDLAREEGNGKRYGNAERLYRNAEVTYDQLKDIADKKKDKEKEKEYAAKQRICDRMKDKAGHKLKGDSHTGVNLGFVRVGKDHDMSDDWE